VEDCGILNNEKVILMNKTIKYIKYFGFLLAPCAMVIIGCQCSPSKPTPDPLAAFHIYDLKYFDSYKAISEDYTNYVHTLSQEEQAQADLFFFYEDESGQHAIKIEIGINGNRWEHILIYDKANRRVKTIKYVAGHYMS
jgi:hypothetical protein